MALFACYRRRKTFFLFSFIYLLGFTSGFSQALRFQDVTNSAGVSTPNDANGYGHGVAAGDFNNDGRPDIYVVNYTALNALFRNNGNGSFTNIASSAGVTHSTSLEDRGVAAADYDNDGDVDIFIATSAAFAKLLYRNNGNNSFSEIAGSAGLSNNGFQGQGVSWGDYNNDGLLDLFLCSYEHAYRLFRQNSNHTFSDVTSSAGLGSATSSVQSVFFDFDLDGDLDLFVSRGQNLPNHLFVNQGNGRFSEEAAARNIDDPGPHGQGITVGDYDNDGDLDVYMCDDRGPNRLYRNDDGYFNEVADEAGVDDNSRSLGCMFADFNNDGWLDLYIINFGVNRLYRNNGDGTFADETNASGANNSNSGYGSAVTDYDNDGLLDIYFSNSGQNSNLLRNTTATSNKWLKLVLRGVASNRNGVGARVLLTAGGQQQIRQSLAGYAMVSGGGDLTLHFGLAGSNAASRVEVIWPSGQIDVLTNVTGNQTLTIQEGDYGSGNDTDPPIISNVQSSNLSSASATITWITNELADSQVEYGLTTGYGNATPLDAANLTNHAVGLTGLAANTTYHYRVKSRDAAGNLATSGDFTFTTNSQNVLLSDNFTGPNIDSNKWNKGSNSGNQAVIENGALKLQSASSHSGWIVTKNAYAGANKIAKLRITQPNDDGDLGLSPTVNLASTNALYGQNNWYRFYVYRDNHTGNYLLFAQWKRNGSVDGLDVTNGLALPSSFWLRLRTDAANIYFEYSTTDVNWTTVYQEPFVLPGYSLSNSFYYEISGNNTPSNGVLRVDDFSLAEAVPTSDTQPPVISQVASGNLTTTAATITWSTDELGDSQVEYGPTTAYGNSTVLAPAPVTNHSVNLTGLSANTLYHYRVHSRDAAGNLATSGDFTFTTAQISALSFTDITLSAGTGGPTDPNQVGGHAAIFSDVDNDGRPDLYHTMLGLTTDPRADLFFHNQGNNVFTEEGAARGIDDFDGGSHGAVFGDLDNDGDFDLYNGTTDAAANVSALNNIYRNNGNGVFTDVTAASGVPLREWQTRATVAFDMESDGDLDLFTVTDYLGTDDPPSDRNEVYRNEGGLQFTAINSGALFEARAGQGATDTDFDNDGDIDLFAANRTGDMNILRNEGNGVFIQIAPATIGINHRAEDGITTADLDNDGDLDLLLSRDDSGTLYRNNGNGTFTFAQNFTATNGYMGGFADLDHDGDLDLVFAGDDVSYLNGGAGDFTAGPSIAVTGIDDPRAIGFADIDNDGDLDFAFGCKRSRNWLVRNNNALNRWLKIKLISPQGQAGAFGAKTKIYAAGQAGGALRGMRESRSNNGYLGQDDQIVHFGLGAQTAVDVVVNFLDGTTVTVANVAANQTITINGVSADTKAPIISQVTASSIGMTGATITWQTNEISTSQVEYGTTTNYGSQSTLNAMLVANHAVNLTGLAANTTYHYRVKSQDLAGNLVQSNDFTFTTAAVANPPVISNVAAASITSTSAQITFNTDQNAAGSVDYDAQTHGTTPVMPLGDSITEGTGSSDDTGYRSGLFNRLSALGTIFDFVGSMQYGTGIPDLDHEGHAGWTANEIYADLNNFLNQSQPRAVLLHIGTNDISGGDNASTVYNDIVAIVDRIYQHNATTKLYLSTLIPRQDSKQSVNDALNGQLPGLVSARTNSGYRIFLVDNSAAFKANVNWASQWMADNVHPNDAGYNVMAQRWYEAYTATEYDLETSNGPSATTHTFTLSNLTPGTTYHYRARAKDNANLESVSADLTFTTLGGQQGTLFSDDFTGNTLDANKWNRGTNSGNQSIVASNVLELRSSGTQTGWITTKNSYAASNTTVSVKVVQPNDDGNLGMSPTYALSSTNGIYNQTTWYRFYVYRDVASGPYQLFVQWKKNNVVDGIEVTGNAVLNGAFHMRLRCDEARIYFEFSVDGQAWTTAYSEPFGLTGYTLNNSFYYELAAYRTGVKGILKMDDFAIRATTSGPDTQPPVISQVASSNITTTSATIAWATDELSDSQVEYGLTTSYGSQTPLDGLTVTNHSVNLNGLSANTTYHYRVKSRDAAGNLATSNDFTFTTNATGGNTLLADDFNTASLDLNKWTKGSNSGNLASIVNNALELRSAGTQTAWVVTKNKYAARNTTVAVKVTQPNNDGDLGMSPSFQASSANGIFNQANWYRFYVYRDASSGPYRLYVQWSKNGAVDGLDVTGSLTITGVVYLRLRFDATRIHFEASLNGQSWTNTYNEVFGLPGYTLDTAFNYELAGYWTDVKGRISVDDFSIATNPTLTKGGNEEAPIEAALPTVFELSQNYPNPFYFNTQLRLALPQEAQVQAVIYDINGREVRQLHHGTMPTGYRVMSWDGANAAGEPVSSGVYFMRVIFQTPTGQREVLTRQLRLMR